jgi:hypothetical protein
VLVQHIPSLFAVTGLQRLELVLENFTRGDADHARVIHDQDKGLGCGGLFCRH